MTNDKRSSTQNRRSMGSNGVSGAIYGLAFIGSLVYFLQRATTFWDGVLGFFKALVWPAILVYKLMEFLRL